MLLVGITFGVMWWRRPAPVSPFEPQAAHAAWVKYLQNDVAALPSNASVAEIRAKREALTAMTIPAEDRETHLALVMSLLAWERGEAQAYQQVMAKIPPKQP